MGDVTESYEWSRHAVGKALRQPLRRAEFDAALAERPARSLASVFLSFGGYTTAEKYFPAVRLPVPLGIADDFLLLASACWIGVDDVSLLGGPLSSRISFYPVPVADRAVAHGLLHADALPQLLDWIRAIEQGPETGFTERRTAVWFRNNGAVRQFEG